MVLMNEDFMRYTKNNIQEGIKKILNKLLHKDKKINLILQLTTIIKYRSTRIK